MAKRKGPGKLMPGPGQVTFAALAVGDYFTHAAEPGRVLCKGSRGAAGYHRAPGICRMGAGAFVTPAKIDGYSNSIAADLNQQRVTYARAIGLPAPEAERGDAPGGVRPGETHPGDDGPGAGPAPDHPGADPG